jgi:opacity protein-like surface antigen
VLALTLLPAIARGQQADSRSVDVGGGVFYAGTLTFDSVDATETAFGGATRTVFKSRSELEASPGLEARVGVSLTSRFRAEASFAFNRTHLTTHITGDPEAPNATATEPVAQYLVQGGLVARLTRGNAGRALPFASAGAGYLRQLHDGQTLIDAGPSYYVGGGVDYLLNRAATRGSKAAGIRADVRGVFLRGSLTLDGRTHVAPVIGAAMFFRF